MNRTDALEMVRQAISSVIPDADVAGLAPQDEFREALEMDSLDFLNFVEVLGERAGVRIDDEDTSRLSTLSASADFLMARTR
ncbi:acyl carrier protein [Streptomyces coelicoflavus]|uniref:acyl carrier protein n=1 Tax=Streptomyces TaxID=1883 RepID=UPI00210A2D38|nr:acyl carrier protein [Streptomyces coelicoflavus]MCQ4199052.1 acyl carrier protein [Streptomyces coelicoflavus]